ncbi:Uma2 family endonuclease [Planktothrix mougeotii]|uniref:Uma2 family endonuclease n=1 Tax=Planktothrix mougeotii LEGE 06226 TaxID=1828728 RepID=A0ABR9UAU5_9CYAN|nr:Uma2 family endonuclease [Planktothrix mougeotii]MBE9143578.1 Uma2 family endonuclease [Planktothrix mougeotii LEGE 06226]
MVTTQEQIITPIITWEKLPDDFILEEEPVENTAQPLIAGALRESLELAGLIQPEMLIASNFGLCATMNGELVIKAPDWVYIKQVKSIEPETTRKSYTPNLQGDIPSIVIEFLSETEGGEYSVKRSYPPGKWYFYEQILQVPIYAIFEPVTGQLEVHSLQNSRYELDKINQNSRYWIEDLKLFLGVWQGEKEQRNGYWLRWWDDAGNILPWGVEKVEQERQIAEQEHQRAEKLAEFLRSQGINPDEIC